MASRTASDGDVGGLLIALSLGACGGLPNDGGRAVSTAMTAEQAALHRDKLGIAGKVKHVAGVHKPLWGDEPETKPILNLAILTGRIQPLDCPSDDESDEDLIEPHQS
jgi:hypothetical protein